MTFEPETIRRPLRTIVHFVAAVFAALTLLTGAAYAQAKRLGLVIGISDYADGAHPTALPDAGLVAQTLKQAGFEVMDGANPTQSEFRALFRDFLDKANAAGPDAVIAVYISGYGLQEDGENILIPGGARLRQRSDLAIEGLRLGDFLRALAGIPGAQKVMMLDAAYQSPYLALVADAGRGFTLVDKTDGLLIAFNHSPGQAAPLPRTSYGTYAMALAEAFREPGLNLNAIFDRVRLRAHTLSEGAETPWHVSGLASPVLLNAPVAVAPGALPAPDIQAADILRQKRYEELSADEAYARAVEIDTITAYEQFVKLHPAHPQSKKVRAIIASRREAAYWARTRKQNSSRAYWSYLKHYPKGSHANEAYARLDRLSASMASPPDFAEIVYDDVPPPPMEEIVVFEQVVADDRWDDVYVPYSAPVGFLPPPPIEIIELPPPPPPVYGSRVLPAVVIGAGVIGAAILANRAWRRPPPVRPAFAPPPVVRPPVMRPTTNQGFVRPAGVMPPQNPGAIRPPVPGVQPVQPPVTRPGAIPVPPPAQPPQSGFQPPRPPQVPGAVPPPGQPPVPGVGPRPTGLPTPQVDPKGQPIVPGTAVRPSQPPVPGVGPRPTGLPTPQVDPKGQPIMPGAVTRPGQPPVPGVGLRPGQPAVTSPQAPIPPKVNAPVVPQPQVARPPAPNAPGVRPMPPQLRPAPPPIARPVAPQVRPNPPPVARPQPTYRPPQPAYRPPPPQVRQPPMVRPQMPVARPAPPAYRPPPPVARPAPAPARPAPRPCTPQMRAARQC